MKNLEKNLFFYSSCILLPALLHQSTKNDRQYRRAFKFSAAWLLFWLLFAGILSANAQRFTDHSFNNINKQLIAPVIVADKEQTSAVYNMEDISVYANKPIDLKYDHIFIGGGYNYTKNKNHHNVEAYIGRHGSTNEKFTGALLVGYYQINSGKEQLTPRGDYFKPRQATYLGMSFMYNWDELNYLGITVRDALDTPITLGDTQTFFYWEAMTPTFYGQLNVIDDGYSKINLYADYSYSDRQKSIYSISANYSNEEFEASVFYNNQLGTSIQYNLEWISIYASTQFPDILKQFNVGVIFH